MNNEIENRCAFWREGLLAAGFCGILEDTYCNGFSEKCTFRKTTEQHKRDTDRAIKANRERGNCENCKYRSAPCRLSTEK